MFGLTALGAVRRCPYQPCDAGGLRADWGPGAAVAHGMPHFLRPSFCSTVSRRPVLVAPLPLPPAHAPFSCPRSPDTPVAHCWNAHAQIYKGTVIFSYICSAMFLLFFLCLIVFQGGLSKTMGLCESQLLPANSNCSTSTTVHRATRAYAQPACRFK